MVAIKSLWPLDSTGYFKSGVMVFIKISILFKLLSKHNITIQTYNVKLKMPTLTCVKGCAV